MTVIYTPWSNLRKDGRMAVGQVGFRDERKVRYYASPPPSFSFPFPLALCAVLKPPIPLARVGIGYETGLQWWGRA